MWNIDLRKIDNYDKFPFESKTTPFLKVSFLDKTITQANSKNEKINMIITSKDEDIILAAWPGNWSQDVFLVDDKPLALAILDDSKEFIEILKTVEKAEIQLGSMGGVKYLSVEYRSKGCHCSTGFSGSKGKRLYDMLISNGIEVKKV